MIGSSIVWAHAHGELKAFRIRNSWRTSTVACAQYIDRQMRVQNDIIRYSDREARHGED